MIIKVAGTALPLFFSDVVYLTATLLCEGTTAHDLSGRFPGSRPIIEFIRPKILRMFSSDVLSRQCSLSIIMYSSDDRNWSTPAKLFQVRRPRHFAFNLCVHVLKFASLSSDILFPVSRFPWQRRVLYFLLFLSDNNFR